MRKYKLEPYRIIYSADIKLISPLIVGSGATENTDSDMMKDKDGNPFLPATSFAGILKHHFERNYNKSNWCNNYFGFSKGEDGRGSKIIFSDLTLKEDKGNKADIRIRDGIRIDNKTGITQDKAKFDFEVIEPGVIFSFKIEIKSDEETIIKKIIKTLEIDLKEGKISLGAKTNSGFGKIELIKGKVSFYNLKEKKSILKWISKKECLIYIDEIKPFKSSSNDLVIDFDFFIKDSLIVKHYSADPDSVDSEHIKSNGKNILPGTSIKGAIHARAERILNTLDIKYKDEFLLFLFGDSMKDYYTKIVGKSKNKGSIPSRLSINEVIIEQNVKASIQQRIKIDRFTGGTIDGALFDSMPIFAKNYDKANKMQIKIKDPIDAEIGLLLLILKDFWTEDLPIGGEKNIGRGVLKGSKIVIKQNDLMIEITDFLNISEANKMKLQSYVNALNNADFSEHIINYNNKYKEILK